MKKSGVREYTAGRIPEKIKSDLKEWTKSMQVMPGIRVDSLHVNARLESLGIVGIIKAGERHY
jgi:hypothetical protein